jgi:nicotinamidase-related amidase
LICGIAIESCVCKTAVDAFERNLTPWVLVDACASHAGTMTHEAGLVVTSRFIGKRQLISTSDLPLRGLLASA